MNQNAKRVAAVADGVLTIQEVADRVGMSRSGVKKIIARYGLPSRNAGAREGKHNPWYKSGVSICLDGYAHVRGRKHVPLHRVLMEKKLGRPLKKEEVVDPIDGLTLHNDIANLRLFANNGEHLRVTLKGRKKTTSRIGMANIGARTDRGRVVTPVDTHRLRKARGDVRLHAILRLARELGIDSPHLWGSSEWLEKAGIPELTHSSLQRAWDDLSRRYEADLLRSE